MGLWLVQECRRSFERAGAPYEYAAARDTARRTLREPFRSLVDPNDGSFLSPDDMATAIQDYCCRPEQNRCRRPKASWSAVPLESLALKYRQVLEGIESLTGERVEVIHVVGGGRKNELLNQFTANASGRPVIAGPTEATALGNVLLQARAAGDIGTLAEIRDVVRAVERADDV